MGYLLEQVGPQSGRRYELTGRESVLGRHPDCQVVIEVGAVSRQHAKISHEGSDYFVEDLHSRNGTFVNEQLLQGKRRLSDGDRVRVCDVTFLFFGDRAATKGLEGSSLTMQGSGLSAILVDDVTGASSSTIMSKLDVSSSNSGRVHLTASPEVKLAALIEITQNLGKALKLDDVLPQTLNSLFKVFVQADRGFIALRNPDGVVAPRWAKARRGDAEDTIRMSRTIVRQVMELKEAILSADAASDERFEMSQSIADFRIRSMMCAPLIDPDGETFGVLQVDTLDQRNRFDKEDLEVLAAVAGQAGIAISNAQLHERALAQRELERDLELARDVQRSFLPKKRPEIGGYSFYDYYEAANHVGGDYFDYIRLADGRLAVIVADVVGHGVAAAMLMAKLSAETRFWLASESHPGTAVSKLNNAMCDLQLERFATMIMAVFDPKSHLVTIVSAGHMPPILLETGGAVSEPGDGVGGLPLGIVADMEYEQAEIELKPGELLLLYTDGINECENADGVAFHIERIKQRMKSGPKTPAQAGQNVVDDVREFLGDGQQQDDMCLVCFGRG